MIYLNQFDGHTPGHMSIDDIAELIFVHCKDRHASIIVAKIIYDAIMPLKTIICKKCSGNGYTSEHYQGCDGNCGTECPVQVPCEYCHGVGTVYIDSPYLLAECKRQAEVIEGLRVVMNGLVDKNQRQAEVIRELKELMKTAVNQLNHVVPTIDPQIGGDDYIESFNAVVSRANHTKLVLSNSLAKLEG